jgi:hypothetical protein
MGELIDKEHFLTHSVRALQDANFRLYNFAKKAAHTKPKFNWK